MLKKLVGKNYSYVFDFTLPPEDEKKPNDLGLLFHGKCEQNAQNVIIRHIANKELIKSVQHLSLVQNIYLALNQVHPDIVQTYDFIYNQDGIFIVKEQLLGIDLQSIIFSGDYPHLRNTKFMLVVGEKVCNILSELHANKIVHRRIQPSNIFIVNNELGQIDAENPTVKLLNFEYAQINGQNILGFKKIPYALYYSAPELIMQSQNLINATCDLYSLGITLYEAISCKHAFVCDKDDNNLLLNMQLSFPIKKNHRTSKTVFEFLQKASSKYIFKTPPQRYNSAARNKYFLYAQHQRFQSAKEMGENIQILIQNIKEEQQSNLLGKIKTVFKRKIKE